MQSSPGESEWGAGPPSAALLFTVGHSGVIRFEGKLYRAPGPQEGGLQTRQGLTTARPPTLQHSGPKTLGPGSSRLEVLVRSAYKACSRATTGLGEKPLGQFLLGQDGGPQTVGSCVSLPGTASGRSPRPQTLLLRLTGQRAPGASGRPPMWLLGTRDPAVFLALLCPNLTSLSPSHSRRERAEGTVGGGGLDSAVTRRPLLLTKVTDLRLALLPLQNPRLRAQCSPHSRWALS